MAEGLGGGLQNLLRRFKSASDLGFISASMNNSNLQCPVDFVAINENKARITAFFVLVLMTIIVYTGWWQLIILLIVDFFLRSSKWGRFSPLGSLADVIIRALQIKNKPVDRAPKRFAASIGLVICTAILIMWKLQMPLTVSILSGMIVLFSLLESFAGFCAGCYVYTGLLLLKKRK